MSVFVSTFISKPKCFLVEVIVRRIQFETEKTKQNKTKQNKNKKQKQKQKQTNKQTEKGGSTIKQNQPIWALS